MQRPLEGVQAGVALGRQPEWVVPVMQTRVARTGTKQKG